MPSGYTVSAGDSASAVAWKVYGDQRMFAELKRLNPGVWYPGRKLVLPDKQKNPFVSSGEMDAARSGQSVAGAQASADRAEAARLSANVATYEATTAARDDPAGLAAITSRRARIARAARVYAEHRGGGSQGLQGGTGGAATPSVAQQLYRAGEVARTGQIGHATQVPSGVLTREQERARLVNNQAIATTTTPQPLVRPGSPLEAIIGAVTGGKSLSEILGATVNPVLQAAGPALAQLNAVNQANDIRDLVNARISPYEEDLRRQQGGQRPVAPSGMMQIAEGQYVSRESVTEAEMWAMWNPTAKAISEDALRITENWKTTGTPWEHEEQTTPASTVPTSMTPAQKAAEIAREWAIQNPDYLKVAHGNVGRQFIGYAEAMARGDFKAAANIMPVRLGPGDMDVLYNWSESQKYAQAQGIESIEQFAYSMGYDWDQQSMYGVGMWIKAGIRAPSVPAYGALPSRRRGRGGGGGAGRGGQSVDSWNWSIRIT